MNFKNIIFWALISAIAPAHEKTHTFLAKALLGGQKNFFYNKILATKVHANVSINLHDPCHTGQVVNQGGDNNRERVLHWACNRSVLLN